MENLDFPLSSGAPAAPVVPAATGSYPTHATAQPAENPFGEPDRQRTRGTSGGVRKRLGSIFAALIALIAKFGVAIKALFVALPNLKLLTTAGTALISVAAYSLFWGWEFAAGFVVLLFIHEMGHVIQLRREGIRASAPMFVPFLGAAVMMKSMPDDALAEARVGLAGPVLGTVGAGACLAIAEAANSDMLRALAYVAFFLNLINLIPVVPFDGGRAMAAMAPAFWFVGLAALVALFFIAENPFLLIFIVFGFLETRRRWAARRTRSLEQAAYYRVARRDRWLVGAVYVGLIVLLALGMHEAHILATEGHTFRSI